MSRNVVDANLCTGCGTCAAMCPVEAIEMREDKRKGIYVPVRNSQKCIGCGTCSEVCPFSSESAHKCSKNTLMGRYVTCYIGHSTDKKLQYNSSSGGLVTQLLLSAMENGSIDGAVVTNMGNGNPLRPKVIIARSKKEVIGAARSKYCPVPVNVAIREIMKHDGRFAIVGLPCHIQGIRKAEMVNSDLSKKIALRLGLFCSHTVNFLGTEFILSRMNVSVEEISGISYRGKGWPGGMTVTLSNGMERFIPMQQYWNQFFGLHFFTPLCCLFCCDMTNELADISFGDAWLPSLQKRKIGESIAVSRTHKGEEVLQELSREGKINLRMIPADIVIQSQWPQLIFKKRNISARVSVFKLLGKKVRLNHCASEQSLLGYVNAIIVFFNTCLLQSNPLAQSLLLKVPKPILKLYSLALFATNIAHFERSMY